MKKHIIKEKMKNLKNHYNNENIIYDYKNIIYSYEYIKENIKNYNLKFAFEFIINCLYICKDMLEKGDFKPIKRETRKTKWGIDDKYVFHNYKNPSECLCSKNEETERLEQGFVQRHSKLFGNLIKPIIYNILIEPEEYISIRSGMPPEIPKSDDEKFNLILHQLTIKDELFEVNSTYYNMLITDQSPNILPIFIKGDFYDFIMSILYIIHWKNKEIRMEDINTNSLLPNLMQKALQPETSLPKSTNTKTQSTKRDISFYENKIILLSI